MSTATINETAFPRLSEEELSLLRPLARVQDFADGEFVFRAGDAEPDLYVVEAGAIDILNPADHDRLVVTHEPGAFSGDIDLLTRRPPLVNGVARGATRVLRVPGEHLRDLLNRVPRFSDKLMSAFTLRRHLLTESGVLGHLVVGPGDCRDTNAVREFLYKNFVPFTWLDTATPEGQAMHQALGAPRITPVIKCSNGQVLINPPLQELARAAGIWHFCPVESTLDLAIVGAGPAGLSAAVYAGSEGLSTLVLDRMGPGGQAGSSSRIENFIGFPTGLTGLELATRSVLQMLKFGARIITPVAVERLEPAACDQTPHTLHLDCGARIQAWNVLIASGIRWRKLEAEGAARFEGAGVYYVCTSVEALLYDGCEVAVVGGGNSAGQAAMYLAECCPGRRIHLLVRGKLGPSISEYLASRIRATAEITVHEGAEIAAIRGGRRIEDVELRGPGVTGDAHLACNAVFVFIGADPSADWIPETLARDKLGYLLTGADVTANGHWPLPEREPCPLETSMPGVLAAGDIRAGSIKRVGFAVGDGSLAVTCTHHLRELRRMAVPARPEAPAVEHLPDAARAA